MNPFAAKARHQYSDKRQQSETWQLSETFYSADKSQRSTVAEMRFSKAAGDSVPKRALPSQSMDGKYQQPGKHLPGKHATYQYRDRALQGSASSAINTERQAGFSKLPHDNQRGRKCVGVQHSTELGGKKKTTATQSDHDTSSRWKSGSTLADQTDSRRVKTPSVPHTTAETGRTPAGTLTSDESAAAIRPEDIIIVRRYNLNSSTAEKQAEDKGQTAKRHVVRLVRNNVVSPLAAGGPSVAGHHMESSTDAGPQSSVKKRQWGGGVKKTHPTETSEGNATAGRVDDNSQPRHIRG